MIPTHGGSAWSFNGDLNRPTLSPSILVHSATRLLDHGPPMTTRQTPRCHSFVRDGRIEFCGDSEHELSGQTVDLPEIETT